MTRETAHFYIKITIYLDKKRFMYDNRWKITQLHTDKMFQAIMYFCGESLVLL